jgi:hypothetical protein
VFAQAVNVERLLNMLRALDPSKGDNLADDEEIQVCVFLKGFLLLRRFDVPFGSRRMLRGRVSLSRTP